MSSHNSREEESGVQTINQPQNCTGWRDISSYDAYGLFPALVARPAYSADQFGPAAGFKDVTGVWRVYMSEGGCDPLPFEPTHWLPMPAPPSSEEQRSSPSEASAGNAGLDDPNPLPPDIKEIVDRVRLFAHRALFSANRDLLNEAASALLSLAGERGEEERYAALGRACEANGLGWYVEDGTMRFQPPAADIAEQAEAQAIAERDEARRERDQTMKVVEGLAWLSEKVTACIDPSGVFDARGLKQTLQETEAARLLAEQERDEAVGVLEPFAKAAERFVDPPNVRTGDSVELWQRGGRVDYLTVGNLRRAAAFLAQHQSPQSFNLELTAEKEGEGDDE